MDDKIHQMVTENIKPSKIEVECKCKKRKDAEAILVRILN